jgi:hypothetical protein
MKALEMKKTTLLITEGWNDPSWSLYEQKHVIPFINDIEKYLKEAQLSQDQITQVFTDVEKGATAAGGNRTALGKGKDAVGAVTDKVKKVWFDKLGAALQQSDVVQGFDKKWEDIKSKVGAENPKLAASLSKYKEFADNNPKTQKFLLMVGAAIAGSLGLAVAGGAAAGIAATGLGVGAGVAIVNIADRLLKNEKLSTAVGRGATAGIVAGLTAAGVKGATELLSKLADSFKVSDGVALMDSPKGPIPISAEDAKLWNDTVKKGMGELSKSMKGISPEDLLNGTDVIGSSTKESYKVAAEILKRASDPAYQEALQSAAIDALGKNVSIDIFVANAAEAAKTIAPVAGAMAGQAAGGAGEKKESKTLTAKEMKIVFEWCLGTPQVLNEGPMDALKKAGSAIAGKVAKVGKNITTKVTADKLMAAWKKAGSPTDSDAVADVLRTAGVRDDVIAPVYKTMSVPLKAKPATDSRVEPTMTKGDTPAASTEQPGAGNAAGGQAAPAAGNAAGTPTPTPIDFKTLQKTVSGLNAQDAKTLLTYIDSLKGAVTPAAGPSTPGATPSQEPAVSGETPAAAPTKNAAAGDTFEKAKGDVRKVQSGTKPLPEPMAAGISADIAKLAKGDKESGVAAADKIMKFAQRGMDVAKLQQAWVANAKAGERFLTQSVYYEITKILKEHNLSWSDLGIRIHLLEGTNKMFGISLV